MFRVLRVAQRKKNDQQTTVVYSVALTVDGFFYSGGRGCGESGVRGISVWDGGAILGNLPIFKIVSGKTRRISRWWTAPETRPAPFESWEWGLSNGAGLVSGDVHHLEIRPCFVRVADIAPSFGPTPLGVALPYLCKFTTPQVRVLMVLVSGMEVWKPVKHEVKRTFLNVNDSCNPQSLQIQYNTCWRYV